MIFPKPIKSLPKASLPFKNATAYLAQLNNQQIVFAEFKKTTNVPEHSHTSQWEVVLEGKVDYFEDGIKHTYKKGDRFFVKSRKKHSAKVYKGYACIMFFNQKDRYKPLKH